MPAPRQNLLPEWSGNRFGINKDEFQASSTYSQNYGIYWDDMPGKKGSHPWAYNGFDYHRLAKGMDLDALAEYVDALETRLTQTPAVAALETRIDGKLRELEGKVVAMDRSLADTSSTFKEKMDKLAEEASTVQMRLSALESAGSSDALSRAMSDLSGAFDTHKAEMKVAVEKINGDNNNHTKALNELEVALRAELDTQKGTQAALEEAATTKMRSLEVAVHGLSVATIAAEDAFDAAQATEDKAKVDLQALEKMVASGVPVDITPAKTAYGNAQQATSLLRSALEVQQSADEAVFKTMPANDGLKEKELEFQTRILASIAISYEEMQEPLLKKMDEVISKREASKPKP